MALVDCVTLPGARRPAGKPRDVAANRPLRMRCELVPGETADVYYFEQRGVKDPLPEGFSGWVACACYDGVAHATTAHRSFCRMERTPEGGIRFPEKIMAAGSLQCMQWIRPVPCAWRMCGSPKPRPTPEQPVSQAQEKPAE